MGFRRVGLVSWPHPGRFSVLALVVRVEVANPTSPDRIQRGDDYVSARDIIPHSFRARQHVLLRMGQPVANRSKLPRRLVRKRRRRSLLERPHLLWDQARCRCRYRWTAFFYPLFLSRV